MSLQATLAALNQAGVLTNKISLDAWRADQEMYASKVALFRQYVEGEHRASLTDEMKNSLRIGKNNRDTLTQFNDNHCAVIVETMVDRLQITAIDADNDSARDWINEQQNNNRFDVLQGDIHEACIRDGNTYLLVDWDNTNQRVRWTTESAYDGVSGMLVVYTEPGVIGAAIKIWRTTTTSASDSARINIYYPDRIEKYISPPSGGLTKYEIEGEDWPAPWTMKTGEALGIPVFHFRNRGADYADYGLGEIENAIPLQDALNRTLYSLTMAEELSAFGVRYAIGFDPPAALTPAMWLRFAYRDSEGKATTPSPDQLEHLKAIRVGMMEHGDLAPFIDSANWKKRELYDVTKTPMPADGNDAASGESQKQREIGLLGKVRRFQPKAGNVWEDVVSYSARLQATYSTKPAPQWTKLNVQWRNPELRDDSTIIANAVAVADRVGEKEFLRMIAPVYGWDESKIEAILAEKAEQQAQATQSRIQTFQSIRPGTEARTAQIPALVSA